MSHSGFGRQIEYSGAGHQNGHVCWIVHSILRGLKRQIGSHQQNTLGYYIVKALELGLPADRDYQAGASLDNGQINRKELRWSNRFLKWLLFVALLWGLLAGCLAAIHAIDVADSSSKEAAFTAEKPAPGGNSSNCVHTSYAKDANHYRPERAYSLSLGRQMFNPAFGLARSEASRHVLADEEIMSATTNNEPDLDPIGKTVVDESMLGEISVPSQSNDSTEQASAQTFSSAQNSAKQIRPVFGSQIEGRQEQSEMSLTDQLFLNRQQTEKPKPKMTIISR